MSEHKVRFEPVGREVTVATGDTILDAAARAGLNLSADCGGRGVCGACRVSVEGEAPAGPSRRRLVPALLEAGERLACLTPIRADLTVQLPERFRPAESIVSFAELTALAEVHSLILSPRLPLPPPGELAERIVGAEHAAELEVPEEGLAAVDRARRKNPQLTVVTRAVPSGQRLVGAVPGKAPARIFGVGLRRIDGAAASELVDLRSGRVVVGLRSPGADVRANARDLIEAHGFTAEQVLAVATVGALLEADASAEAPLAGLPVHEAAVLFEIGASRAGVSPELLAGAVAAGLGAGDGPARVYADFGPGGGWVADGPGGCFAAPAPALLGAGLSPAQVEPGPGAVQSVALDSDGGVRVDLVRSGTPVGFTGAGLVELVQRMRERGTHGPCTLAVQRGTELALSAADLEHLERVGSAHARARASAMDAAGCAVDALHTVIVAGGLGEDLSVEAFVELDLLPWSKDTIFRYLVEDGALVGARMTLVSGRARAAAARLAERLLPVDPDAGGA